MATAGNGKKPGRGRAKLFDPDKVKWNPRGSNIQRHWDAVCPGLCLNVRPAPGDKRSTGRKSWELRYTVTERDGDATNKKQRIIKIGDYPETDLDAARELALDLKGEVKRGGDPKDSIRNRYGPSQLTAKAVLDLMLKDDAFDLTRRSPGYRNNIKFNLEKHAMPTLGDRLVESLTKDDWLRCVDKLIQKRSYGAAKNLVGYIGAFYLHAQSHPELRSLRNPLRDQKVHIPGNGPRERVLSFDELIALWGWFKNPLHRAMTQVLVLTGQRLGEVLRMRWDRLEDDVWIVGDKGEMKNKSSAHHLPLTDEVLAAIEPMKEYPESPWVFPGHDSHLTHGAYQQAIARFIRDARVSRFTPHDIRRSFITHSINNNIDSVAVARVVHHSIGGVTHQVYFHGQALEAKEQALNAWVDLLRRKGIAL